MKALKALVGPRVFDGAIWHDHAALLFQDGKVVAITTIGSVPEEAERIESDNSLVVPGFIDLQVNGGGGVLLNERPTVECIASICAAHAEFGTTALLPTLITDTPQVTARAVEAGKLAKRQNVPGFLGLHLEGPHLSLAKKGAHDPNLIRRMEADDLKLMLSCAGDFDVLMATVAPENVTVDQVSKMSGAGIVISLGHTDAAYSTIACYAAAGARLVTHLFNAMSPLGHREPGVVGAALDLGMLHAGLITDGIHVSPASIRIALRSKKGPGRIFIVTDAMAPIGTDMTSFNLNGRTVLRRGGRLTLSDGTLAGADIDMIASVRYMHSALGLQLEDALKMATVYPAEVVRLAEKKGRLKLGFDADFVVMSANLEIQSTWIAGHRVYGV